MAILTEIDQHFVRLERAEALEIGQPGFPPGKDQLVVRTAERSTIRCDPGRQLEIAKFLFQPLCYDIIARGPDSHGAIVGFPQSIPCQRFSRLRTPAFGLIVPVLMQFLESWRRWHEKTPKHKPERTLAIGDIHGCSMPLANLMDAVNPGPKDLVVYLGDYIDRGPDTRGVIDFIIKQADLLPVIALRGNHELMMLDARFGGFRYHNWQTVGGWETLESYGWQNEREWQNFIPAEHWKFLDATLPFFEGEQHIFVHAHLHPTTPLSKQSDYEIYWEKCRELELHQSGKKAVVGHTRQADGFPRVFPGGVCIDTAAVSGQWLTCLCTETGDYWQANMEGRVRKGALNGWLPELREE